MKIGYARVSTAEQNLHLQLDALKAEIYEEYASGVVAYSIPGALIFPEQTVLY